MTEKESLWYLIDGFLDGKYNIKDFCGEFTRIYNLELDYDELSEMEHEEFKELCELAARFSDDEEELKIPKMYVSELEIQNKVRKIVEFRRKK